MCCGQKRTGLRSAPRTETTTPLRQRISEAFRVPGAASQLLAANGMPQSAVPLRYSQNSPIRVRGPVTGRQYEFRAGHSIQQVDPRDAPALLRVPYFRLV